MGTQFAWIDDGSRRWVARAEESWVAQSAVTSLIQGIYDREPGQARRILRHRIRATQTTLTEMCWGMIRVAAKRVECGVPKDQLASRPGDIIVEIGPWSNELPAAVFGMGLPPGALGHASADAGPMEAALALAARVPERALRYQSDRRIAAVLVSGQGRPLAWAVNSSASNKTLHAEVNLIQGYCRSTGEALPAGAAIYTTLKSCKMCAGMIWQAARDPLSLRVFFAEDDPGPRARRTVLNPLTHERIRAVARMALAERAEGERRVLEQRWLHSC